MEEEDDSYEYKLDVAFNPPIKENDKFVANKLSYEFKKTYWKFQYLLGDTSNISKYKEMLDDDVFWPAKLDKLEYFGIIEIIVMIIFSFTFYLLLINIIITGDTASIVLIVFIYLLGSIIQLYIVPIPMYYYSRSELESDLSKLLNCDVNFFLYYPITYKENSKIKKNVIQYPGNYIFDITGKINIPKSVSYIKIDSKIQYYFERKFKDFKVMFETIKFGEPNTKITLEYKGNQLESGRLYNINSSRSGYSVSYLDRILCLLLLEWVYVLLFKCYKPNIVTIYLAKLILKKKTFSSSTTNITIHGKLFKAKDFVHLNIDSTDADELEKEHKQHKKELEDIERKAMEKELKKELKKERKRKEKWQKEKEIREQKEREIEANTEELSKLKNNNYLLVVKRVYNDVFAHLSVYNKTKNFHEKINLGEYNPELEEEYEDEGDITIFYPRGNDTKIQIITQGTKYIVKIGPQFTGTYYLYDHS